METLSSTVAREKGRRFFAAHDLEWGAAGYFEDECSETVAVPSEVLADLIHSALIVVFEAAAQSIGQHFFAEAPDEIVPLFLEQDRLEFSRTIKRFAADQFAGGVNGLAFVFSPPRSDGVVILQAEAKGIHARVAG